VNAECSPQQRFWGHFSPKGPPSFTLCAVVPGSLRTRTFTTCLTASRTAAGRPRAAGHAGAWKPRREGPVCRAASGGDSGLTRALRKAANPSRGRTTKAQRRCYRERSTFLTRSQTIPPSEGERKPRSGWRSYPEEAIQGVLSTASSPSGVSPSPLALHCRGRCVLRPSHHDVNLHRCVRPQQVAQIALPRSVDGSDAHYTATRTQLGVSDRGAQGLVPAPRRRAGTRCQW
jgi:hypothetical protein